jgi:hypothetical protein
MRKKQHSPEHKEFAQGFASLLVNRRYDNAHRLLADDLREQVTSDDLRNRFEQEFPEIPLNSDDIAILEIKSLLNERVEYPDSIQVSLDNSDLNKIYIQVVEGAENKLFIQTFEFKRT